MVLVREFLLVLIHMAGVVKLASGGGKAPREAKSRVYGGQSVVRLLVTARRPAGWVRLLLPVVGALAVPAVGGVHAIPLGDSRQYVPELFVEVHFVLSQSLSLSPITKQW